MVVDGHPPSTSDDIYLGAQGEYCVDQGPWDLKKFPARKTREGDPPGTLRDGKGDPYKVCKVSVTYDGSL
jgi:hypothetical protein